MRYLSGPLANTAAVLPPGLHLAVRRQRTKRTVSLVVVVATVVAVPIAANLQKVLLTVPNITRHGVRLLLTPLVHLHRTIPDRTAPNPVIGVLKSP
jgi:threonine/homoserine efflux transporter RhtA